MKHINTFALVLALASSAHARFAQQDGNAAGPSFDDAAQAIQRQLESSVQELDQLRTRIADEKIPKARELSDLEAELIRVRAEYQQTSRLFDSRTLDLTNLRTEIKAREEESAYLSRLLGQYVDEYEAGLPIAELQRYEDELEAATLAPENSNLTTQQVFDAQLALVTSSLDRLEDALGGTRFEGTAIDPSGLVQKGTFVMVGPATLFRSADGKRVGSVAQLTNSLEPTELDFNDPLDVAAASQLITTGAGTFPLDPTLGNAHKIEETQESLWEHIQKGGPVMVPIFVLAGLALLVALYKWLTLAFVPKIPQKKIDALLSAIAQRDEQAAQERVAQLKGPVGRMLSIGVEHLREPRELIEEVMYETVLTTRLKLERMLPFIAISAASAPLLGLLGTVTGIISTFKLITVFGSGDVKMLSGGISEALITTEFGLIVAIPSLLLHAFLSRKARGVVSQMEGAAVALINQVSKTPLEGSASGAVAPDPDLVKRQLRELLDELLVPAVKEVLESKPPRVRTAQTS